MALAPLEKAVRDCRADMVQLLFEYGAVPDQLDEDGVPLVFDVITGGSAEMLKLFLDRKVNVHVRDSSGRQPLERAVESNNNLMVDLLLSKGANPNKKNRADRSLLKSAIVKDNSYLVKSLLEYKADPNP